MYELATRNATNLTNNLKSRGLDYQIKVIGEQNRQKREEDGVYVIFGTNSKAIENISMDEQSFLEEYSNQEINKSSIFPNYTIMKLNNGFVSSSQFCDVRNQIELIKELFKRKKLEVPKEINYEDYRMLSRSYFNNLNEENNIEDRINAKEDLNYYLDILSSGMSQNEYEKLHGKRKFSNDKKINKELYKKLNKMTSEEVVYNAKNENCLDINELIIEYPELKSLNVDHDILPRFEEEIKKYPKLFYSIAKKSTETPYGDYNSKYWHILTFPSQYEKIFTAIVHKLEHNLEDISKKYSEGLEETTSISILYSDFDMFYEFAKQNHLTFYFDELGVYSPSTVDSIGIVIEDDFNKELVITALTQIMHNKINSSYVKDKEKVNERKIHNTSDIEL